MERPRIKKTTERLESPDGDIYLQRPGMGSDVKVEKPDEKSRRLLEALDGEHSRAQLEEEFGAEEIERVLAEMSALGVVEDAADDDRVPADVMARFDRQLRYFSDVTTGPAPSECQERLEAARVAVLGVGGLGGWSALALACCGVGEMLLLDFDLVELTNLNRQVLYGEADVGRPKAKAAAERLAAFNSRMSLRAEERKLASEDDVAEAIAGHDVVIDAVDWPAHDIESWVNAACFAAGVPYVAMSHFPPIARVGPFYVPGETACYECQLIGYRREYPLFDVAVEQRRGKPSPTATLGPACGLIGNHVALDVMHRLTGLAPPSTLGASHIYDLRTMEVEEERISPEPECPVCAEIPRLNEAAPT